MARKSAGGKYLDAIFATIDFLPTFSSLAGYEIPTDRHIDGVDQLDLLLGKTDSGRDHFYFNRAGVRRGRWKYLRASAHFYGYAIEPNREKVEELYDLKMDIGETKNVALQYPKLLAELRELTQSIEGSDAGESEPGIQ